MIIKNALGLPKPEAYISHFGSPTDGYYRITMAAEKPEALDSKYPTVDAAIAAAEKYGFELSCRGVDGRGDPMAKMIHVETKSALDALIAASDAKWAGAKPCYVRYGKLPKGGRSINHADGSLEAGVSVYYGERLPSGEARALPRSNMELAGALSIMDRQLYIVTGELAGTGSDGEPVLRNCRIWRKAK